MTTTTPASTDAPRLRLTAHERRALVIDALGTKFRFVPVLVTLAIIWTVFTLANPTFLSPRNLSNLSDQIAVTAILALGLVLVLLVGEIDLSVATLSAVSGAIVGVLVVNQGFPLVPAFMIGLLFGGLFGLLQGSIVMFLGAPAFIVTLGGQLVLSGLLLVFLPSSTGLVPLAGTPLAAVANTDIPPVFSYTAAAVAGLAVMALQWSSHRKRVANDLPSSAGRTLGVGFAILVGLMALAVLFNSYRGVPSAVGILAILVAFLSYVMTQTRYGTWLYAIGGNREAARRAGIPVRAIKISAFVILGMLASVAGVVAASRVLGVSAASDSPTLLLEAIAAAVIGGTSLFGGRGNIWSAIIGALVIGSIASGMFLINASTEARLFVQGGVLIVAVVADALIARNSRSVIK